MIDSGSGSDEMFNTLAHLLHALRVRFIRSRQIPRTIGPGLHKRTTRCTANQSKPEQPDLEFDRDDQYTGTLQIDWIAIGQKP
jgi:hypothetical protein